MRRTIRTIVLIALFLVPAHAAADDYVACWIDEVVDPLSGRIQPVTRCRLAGGDIVDYAGDNQVPAVLSPSVGTDLLGDCWYLTSASTNWIYLNLYINGDAVLGWDADPTTPGGVAYATDRIPRCTSEPIPVSDPSAEVWDYVTSYIHPPPEPDLSPPSGGGITGLETHVGVSVPEDHAATLVAGGLSLDVEIEVAGVVVVWGDGESDSYPADESALSGYPDGIARHVYEVKDETGYNLAVSYIWTARWRASGGSW
ncbi:MAG: hypothetical protein WDZ96_05300, partial [Acidimicrobiia bacterium]